MKNGFEDISDSTGGGLIEPASASIRRLLKLDSAAAGRKFTPKLVGAVFFGVLGIALWWIFGNGTSAAYTYTTAEVTKGRLVVSVTATGQLEPLNKVDIGSEVSGTIEDVLVDYNDPVQEGQVLARLDTDKLEAQAAQSKAAFHSAEARLLQAQANRAEAEAKLSRLNKVHELSGGKMPSLDEMDAAEAAQKRAIAEEASARAAIAQAEAQLKVDETNLTKAVIRSPINGIVLERKVEPGQTVAASLQAPLLFTIAEDLRQLSLHVKVDEADVGAVRAGQAATFTVDAYPDKRFSAAIAQVRYAPLNEAGVVTYETLLTVDNPELLLRPGMTATAEVVVDQVEDTVLVPNAALRFAPPQDEVRSSGGRGFMGGMFRRPRRSRGPRGSAEPESNVWIIKGGEPQAVPLQLGATDGERTAVLGGGIEPGQEVIIDAVALK